MEPPYEGVGDRRSFDKLNGWLGLVEMALESSLSTCRITLSEVLPFDGYFKCVPLSCCATE